MLGDLDRDGSFYLSEVRLEEMFGGPISDGPHQLHLIARDVRGYASPTFSVSFTLDKEAPLLEVESPIPGTVYADNMEASGAVYDTTSSVASLVSKVDLEPWFDVTIDPQGLFAFDTAFALDGSDDGQHTIEFVATDQAGNVSAPNSVSFVLATALPPDPSTVAPPWTLQWPRRWRLPLHFSTPAMIQFRLVWILIRSSHNV